MEKKISGLYYCTLKYSSLVPLGQHPEVDTVYRVIRCEHHEHQPVMRLFRPSSDVPKSINNWVLSPRGLYRVVSIGQGGDDPWVELERVKGDTVS